MLTTTLTSPSICAAGVKNFELLPKVEEKEDTVSVTLCNERCEGQNASRMSTADTLASEKDSKTSKDNIIFVDMNDQGISSSEGPPGPAEQPKGGTKKGVSSGSVSCVIQFDTMWYNFAAPPQTPITRKIDYTRYVL